MCGIAGTLIFDKAKGDLADRAEKTVRQMSDRLIHRGPDAEGYWCDLSSGIHLAHRRLSIVDLSDSASQPMINDDGSVVLVYNGEVYNAAELRRELEATGKHRWKTDHSDTEVVLRAYEEWGEECLRRLRGMFAFAIWDSRKRSLWLVRDRLGIKPLYYALDAHRVVFASEIKALLEDQRISRAIDLEALYHYLTFYVAPAPKTVFDGVSKLEPGCSLWVSSRGEVRHRRWWDPLTAAKPLFDLDLEEYKQAVGGALEEAVRLHKVADVPVGVFLSGGLDSSINAALFAKGEPKPIRTFSLGYAGSFESYTNEYEHARLMASEVGARHYEVDISPFDFLTFLPRMIEQLDEPLGDPVAASIYFLSSLAKNEGVTVCQLGEGSDELFGGYRSWQVLLALQRYGAWLPNPLLRLGTRLGGMVSSRDVRPALWLERMSRGMPAFFGGAEGFTDREKQGILSPEARQATEGLSSWQVIKPFWERFEKNAVLNGPLQWMSFLDLSFRVPELLLMRVDKMTMAASLEARVPFLDHKVVEVVMGIPENIRMRHLKRKYLLRKAMSDLLPVSIATRGKQGFRVPIAEWLQMPAFVLLAREAISRFAEHSGVLTGTAASVADHPDKRRVWLLLALAMWWDIYFGSRSINVERWIPLLEETQTRF